MVANVKGERGGVTQVGAYGMMVVESLQPREGRNTGRGVATVLNGGTEATRVVTGRLM